MKKTITILLAAIGIMSCGNNPTQAENMKDKAWKEIAPTEIELNPVKMIDKDWLAVRRLGLSTATKILYYMNVLRRDMSLPSALNLWCVSDNLRKGAATHAVQIAELLLRFCQK